MALDFNELMVRIHTANMQYIIECWEEWNLYISETLKAKVEENYPQGFKSFLVEKIDKEIKKNSLS